MSKAAIEEIERQLKIKSDDVLALERTLSILLGQEISSSPTGAKLVQQTLGIDIPMNGQAKMNILDYASEVLRKAGKPLTTDALITGMDSLGCTFGKQSILGRIYGAAKSNRLIKLEQSGVFGLLEWDTNNNTSSVATEEVLNKNMGVESLRAD